MTTDRTNTTKLGVWELAKKISERREVDKAWGEFVAAAQAFAVHLDQWEKIKFKTEFGMVYVSITREELYPDSFEEISDEQT